MADAIEVVVQIAGADLPAGRLWSHRRRGAESATFAYFDRYLAHPDAYELDPSLPLRAGQHQAPGSQAIFGAFSDAAPDRWGRRLVARALQTRTGGPERRLGEIDYLLGVRDDARQGALRFRLPGEEAYLAPEITRVPSPAELPTLVAAADRLDRDAASDEDLQLLLTGGSSLGGARPKVHAIDGDGRLAIAKLPSPSSDKWDVIRWEAVALRLARDAGIKVPDWTLQTVDGRPVLVIDRFDRDGDWRVGYVSAMTMLAAGDGDRASYLDIAEVIETQSPSAGDDLCELWRRIVFTVLISNTDDHLRNHGFLRTGRGGWTLAPAFDLNPDPRPGPARLSTTIDGADATASLERAIEVAPCFRLDPDRVRTILQEVAEAVGQWRRAAAEVGIPSSEIRQMADAFDAPLSTVDLLGLPA